MPRVPLGQREILRLVPHRRPFLMIDRVTEIEPEVRAVAHKNVSHGEDLVPCSVTGQPVLPRLMVIESVGQAALVLLRYGAGQDEDGAIVPLFVGCEYSFHSEVEAGCRLDVEVQIEKLVSAAAIVRGSASVSGRPVAEMRMTAAMQRQLQEEPETPARGGVVR